MPRQYLTTHQGADYIAVLREGQTTDDAIVTIKYPSKADVALAHQFAAAPDLLRALEALLNALPDKEGRFQPSHMKKPLADAAAAIAKARGQS